MEETKRNGKDGKRHNKRWFFAVRYVVFCNAKGLIKRERKKFTYFAGREKRGMKSKGRKSEYSKSR